MGVPIGCANWAGERVVELFLGSRDHDAFRRAHCLLSLQVLGHYVLSSGFGGDRGSVRLKRQSSVPHPVKDVLILVTRIRGQRYRIQFVQELFQYLVPGALTRLKIQVGTLVRKERLFVQFPLPIPLYPLFSPDGAFTGTIVPAHSGATLPSLFLLKGRPEPPPSVSSCEFSRSMKPRSR